MRHPVAVSPEFERLQFLCRIVRKEVLHLNETTSRLFANTAETSAEEVGHWLAEPELSERLGWMDSAEDWMACRTLRNQMIHEYIEDIHVLTHALNAGKNFVPEMGKTSFRIINEVELRLPSSLLTPD